MPFMNGNTRTDLIAFIESVESFARSVQSVSGSDPCVLDQLLNASELLKRQLEHDETILP